MPAESLGRSEQPRRVGCSLRTVDSGSDPLLPPAPPLQPPQLQRRRSCSWRVVGGVLSTAHPSGQLLRPAGCGSNGSLAPLRGGPSSWNSLSYGAVPFVVADPGVPSPDSHRGESVHGPVAARSFKPKPQASKTTGYTPPVVLEPKASYKTRACAHVGVGAREVLILNKHRSKHNFSTN